MKLIDADLLRSAFPEPTDWNDIEETIYHIREIWKIIDGQPEAERTENDWTLCSKRQPERADWYIVTTSDQITGSKWFSPLRGWETSNDEVIAWKPFPEPFKEAEKDA